MDIFGAIGISRCILYYSKKGYDNNKIIEKSIRVIKEKFENLELDQTKELAKDNFEYAINYFKKLQQELNSKQF